MAKTDTNIDDIIVAIILTSCSILNLIALIHIIYKFYINPNKKIARLTKSVVITSIILLLIHCLTHTIFQLLFILEDSALPIILTPFICKSGVVIISVSFYIGKSFLFCFYIIRAAISFKGSNIEYSNKQVSFYCFIIIALGLISTIGWPIIQLPFTHPDIDEYGNSYCIVSAAAEDDYNYHNANTYFLIYATLIEIIISIWTVWLFVGKLATRSHITYLYRKQSYRDRNSNGGISVTSHLSEDESGNNDITSLDDLNSNNNNHVQIWYESTKDVNKTLLIITKLLILLIVSIITSQIALVLFLTIVPRAYGIDSCINIYCIYLSLGFTNNIWKKVFCGTQCLRSCFPLIKMWTLTKIEIRMNCRRKDKERVRVSEIDADDNASQSPEVGNMDKCVCSIYNQQQSAMHKMICKEYKLFISKS